ncbi:MAG: 1-acyl-sn-glycerol-3-phosphate acyltransferase [Planctomycetaceae bacterium]|nr:1-acyl-sn-glycerol-3-phosphate acyltransferase [Planctomycetaceae bacterium]MBQ2821875.1 1-acyl-sn-glycerol-3-phosphate acyltransferase [Thermoguttaceae bacterium]MDO4425212.1 lysophospholipid acyltransferase family protein [Planctomycetia bacterium]
MSLFDRFYYRLWVFITYVLGKIFFRLEYRYQDQIPKEGKLVVIANHQSFLDPPMIGTGMPRFSHYMARDTLFKGLFGWHIRHLNAFPISRDKNPIAGIKETLKRLKEEQAVIIFPEGTRSEDGRLGEFQKGIISVARRSKAPILPCVIQGAYDAFPRHSKFVHLHKIIITYGKLIPAEKVQEMNEDELLLFLRGIIAEMLGEESGNSETDEKMKAE